MSAFDVLQCPSTGLRVAERTGQSVAQFCPNAPAIFNIISTSTAPVTVFNVTASSSAIECYVQNAEYGAPAVCC